ncbi:MAG: hypothetical protein KF878_37890 [Planctomycetes bacterium]|nr:hypothetical protein [Planctomycetota bacterium]MCW8141052.1 hypothetical protein [Planctomycetota bacterium]
MSIGTVLLGVLVLSILVALGAFVSGDRARRKAQGQAGPRPAASIGEAARLAQQRRGHALVLFLGDDPASAEAARALAEEPAVLRLLAQPLLPYAVVRSGGDEREVAGVLFEKYAQEPLPAGPACVLLDEQGKRVALAASPGPLATWLEPWLAAAGAATAPAR